jgi:hypothetical protein
MDKYQSKLLEKGVYLQVKTSIDDRDGKEIKPWPNDSITIIQDKDYHHNLYCLSIISSVAEKVETFKSGKWEEVIGQPDLTHTYWEAKVNDYNIDLDFNSRVEKIKFVFKKDLADDFELNIEYKESDKSIFDKETEEKRIADLVQKMSVRTTTGDDLINVMFAVVSEDVKKTEVDLYSLDNQKNRSPMGKFPVEEGMMFKSITGLAYGTYSIQVIQFDSANNIIVQSGFYDVVLRRPNYGGKPTISPW